MSTNGAKRWICLTCHTQPRRQTSRSNRERCSPERRELIAELAAQGLSANLIKRLTGANSETVRTALGPNYTPRLCGCGRSGSHLGMCSSRFAANQEREIQRRAAEFIPGIDIETRIANALPAGLTRDTREEVSQEMMLAISEHVDSVVCNVAQFIRDHFKRTNGNGNRQHLSLDTDFTYLADVLAG